MKKITVAVVLFLLGFTLACSAEEWFAAGEETCHDFVGDSAALLLAKEDSGSIYVPDYTASELASAINNINKFSDTMSLNKINSAPAMAASEMGAEAIPASRGSPPSPE